MELNPNSAMEQSSLPLDLPLPNLPMVKEESGITDPSNSLIKEEKATPTPSADNSPDNSGAEDQDRSDSEGPKFRNSQDFHENDTNANENIPMNGTVITNNITITKEEINDN